MEQSVKEAKQEIKGLLIEKIDNNTQKYTNTNEGKQILKKENEILKG